MSFLVDDNLLSYLIKYGKHTIAYSSVYDEEMVSFYLEGKGYIQYAKFKYFRFMLGDPLCSEVDLNDVVEAFIKDASKNNELIMGIQCSLETGKIFTNFGYNVNHMGVETILYLDTFNTSGKAKNKVRRWLNSASKAGLEVKEESLADPVIAQAINKITEKWLKNKANESELSLLTRPFKENPEPGVRIFCGYLEDEIVGVNTFEPMYENEKVVGYYANICRIDDSAPNGTLDLIQDVARGFFKEEGCKYFSFGLSPFSEISDENNIHNPIITSLLQANYKYGNDLYSFQGLDFHKKAYHDGKSSERRPSFLISKGSLPVNQAINALGYIGILPDTNFVSSLTYLGECMLKGFYNTHKDKFTVTEEDLKKIMPKLMGGLSFKEIADSLHLNALLIEDFARSITNIGKQKLPEFQENIYVQRNMNDMTRDVFNTIEAIVDEDKDAHFVYNIAIIPSSKGFYASMTIEVNGKISVNKANFISARLKSKITQEASCKLDGVFIEVVPTGQFAHKIGLDAVKEETFEF